MLRCQDVAEQISDDIDGALPWRRRLAIRLHMLLCDGCRRYVRQMRACVAALRTAGEPPVDATPPDGATTSDRARQLFRSAR